MSKLLKISFGIISVITLLFLNFGFANAEEVPDTKLTNERNDTWECRLDDDGQKTLRVDPYGPVNTKRCPLHLGQQSTCKEFVDDSYYKGGVVCVYTPAGSPPDQSGGASTQGDFYWTINGEEPGSVYIDGNTPKVTIKFFGLDPDPDADAVYAYRKTDQEGAKSLKDRANIQDGIITLDVCGAGSDALKAKGVGSNKDCKTDGSDFFHEGHIYQLGLYNDAFGQAQIMVAGFYVKHSAPAIKISSTDLGNLSGVQVSLSGRRPGGDNRNNYQMVLENDIGYKEEHCVTTNKSDPKTIPLDSQKDFLNPPISGNAAGNTFTQESSGIPNGDYVLKVYEQINEGRPGPDCQDSNEDGFLYVEVPVTLSGGDIELGEPVFDPEGEEYEAFLKELASLNGAGGKSYFPCGDGISANLTPVPLGKCPSLDTAIRSISTTPEGFITDIFSFVLAIAGFGAIILIIYSGYLFMTSQGDKERIAGARETITSAIVGLLFIILSFIVLEIIGFDILRIPGLGR